MAIESEADEVTRVSPQQGGSSGEPTIQSVPAYQAPRAYTPPGAPPPQSKRKAWPWVLGILALLLLLLVGMGIAAAIFVPRMLRDAANNNNSNVNRNNQVDSNQNNSNSNNVIEETNDNSAIDESKPVPTDEQQVLADLTELEHEWTVANINADKTKLGRILADDYVGNDASGKAQGKAEYLRTIQRDTSIQKWDFEDLKVELNGDRAALSGIIRLQIEDKPVVYRFTDKFVWRDGRWQAVGSEVTPVQE